jgi:hypothetical protein
LESLKGGDNSEDISMDGRIILKWILNVDQIHLAQDRKQWQARVNMVVNLLQVYYHVYKQWGIS